jgi:hypothetical protein
VAKKFASVSEAIQRGRVSDIYPRLDAGFANMHEFIPILNRYREGIPLVFLMLKGAWESKGNPQAQSASRRDVGLFQLLLSKPYGSKLGYSFEQLKDPDINTKVYTDIVRSNVDSFMKTHGGWFPEGVSDWQFWGIMWLSTGIGSHATRHLLNAIGPGARSFDRVVAWVTNHPQWMVAPAQLTGFKGKSHWGVQSGALVAFRVIIGKRLVDYARNYERTSLPASAAAGVLGAGAKWPIVVGALAMAGTLAGVSILYLENRKRRTSWTGSVGSRHTPRPTVHHWN